MPPILRRKVLELEPHIDEGHIVVYQSNSTHSALIDFCARRDEAQDLPPCFRLRTRKAGQEMSFSTKGRGSFLRLLEGCSYRVIQGGSHTLMGEALYLGKPVLACRFIR